MEELEGQIGSKGQQIADMKQHLENIVKDYGYSNVDDFSAKTDYTKQLNT